MYREKPIRLFIRYALPQMIGLLLNSVYFVVDGLFIGNRLGRDSMAAAAISVPVLEMLIALSMLISVGAGIAISSSLGKGEEKKANTILNLSLTVIAFFSCFILVVGNVFIDELAILLGSTSEIHEEAVTYLWYILTFSPALLYSFAFSGYARNDNRPKLAMTALAVGAFSNILLDYVFMYPLNMGIAGAALATALGPILSVLILLPHFLRKKGMLYIARFQFSAKACWNIFYLGFPAFITEFSIGIVTFLYNFSIVKKGFGEIGLAAYLTIGYLMLVILTLFLGASQGMQPIISYFDGRNQHQKNRELFIFCLKAMLSIGIVAYVSLLLFSRYFIAFFTPGDLELIAFTQEKTRLYFWGFPFAGVNILCITFLQSCKKSWEASLLSLSRSVIFLPPSIFLLSALFGNDAIWSALSVTEALTLLSAVFYHRHIRSKGTLFRF